MANRTVKEAHTIHGTNPQYLIEKIIRTRIYESKYWKEDCFALNMAILVDRAVDMRFIGGVYGGNIKPSPFICLVQKMLQLQPDDEIVYELIQQEYFKYIRALGAFYLRLTGTPVQIWSRLEPLFADYRKLRVIDGMGKFQVTTMDDYIDDLLRQDRLFDVILPRISKRFVLEEGGDLQPRKWLIDIYKEQEEDEQREHEADEKAREAQGTEKDEDDSYRTGSRYDSHRHHGEQRRSRRDRSDSSSRSRSRSRDRKRRSRSRDNDRSGNSNRRKTEADEIEEQNKLRAKLGLKPLRV